MITTNDYNPQKISLGSLKNKKSNYGLKYQTIPILYDRRKAIVYLCGRFQLVPDFCLDNDVADAESDSLAVKVDDDNRKLFEDFEKKLQSLTDYEVKLIQYGCVYLRIYYIDGKIMPRFWKVFEKEGKEYKEEIRDKESLDWKTIEGEIIFSIANIFVEKKRKKYYLCRKRIFCEGNIAIQEFFWNSSWGRQ